MGASAVPVEASNLLANSIADVIAAMYGTPNACMTEVLYQLHGIFPTLHSSKGQNEGKKSLAANEELHTEGLSTAGIAKLKNRENARKNRLKKKMYIATLEESLKTLKSVMNAFRSIIVNNLGESAVPKL